MPKGEFCNLCHSACWTTYPYYYDGHTLQICSHCWIERAKFIFREVLRTGEWAARAPINELYHDVMVKLPDLISQLDVSTKSTFEPEDLLDVPF